MIEGISDEIPKFVQLLEANQSAHVGKASIKAITDDVFNVAVQRGLNDGEFALLLNFFCKGSLSMSDRLKLLRNLVPENKVSAAAIHQFMIWFISRFRRDSELFRYSASPRILQWIIGLLEHDLVESSEIDNFYYDLFEMLDYPSLVPFVAKLLCRLTKPDDVTSQIVMTFMYSYFLEASNKYLLAVLNVFKSYKPHLMIEDVKKVDILKVLGSVNQTMDSVMRVRVLSSRAPHLPTKALAIREIPAKNFSYFKEEMNKISSLIPLPTYDNGMDKFAACYPHSVKEAFRKFSRVPIPQNIMSLLHNDVGFFMITYQGIEIQMRFQNSLMQTLQNALIYQQFKSSDEDVEFLLRRVYCLQTFMQQGIPSVSVFLSGYLLDWDGVDHRYNILKLIEYATFHSFSELACNILRPLHMLFVTDNTNRRREIIRTMTNLIRNMFADVYRVQQGIPFPFLKRGPRWTKEPETMLCALVSWTQNLITLGLSIEKNTTPLLEEALHFYEMINRFEDDSDLQMFTVVSEGVALLSLPSQAPNTIIRICRLLMRYHKVFLPQLRLKNPHFYKQCKEKISLTSNYAQRIIYFLQNGEVVLSRKENGIVIRDIPNESVAAGAESFSLTSHTCFVASYVMFEKKKNDLNLSNPDHRRTSVELASTYLREITEFINCFSTSRIPESYSN